MADPVPLGFDPHADFRMSAFLKRCSEENPGHFWFASISGSFALFFTLSMCFRQSQALSKRPLCMQRTYYRGMLIFPMVWALCCWCVLFAPLSHPLAELFMGQSEAQAIYSFLVILLMLVSIEARKRRPLGGLDPAGGSTAAPLESVLDPTNMGIVIMQAVRDYGPQTYFAVPPFGCFFKRCCTPHHLSARQLLWASCLVKQYGILQIVVNSYFMWARLTLRKADASQVEPIARTCLKISGMLAVYGLFVMYKATYDLLHDWNTTRKFMAVKLVIGLSVVQEKVVSKLMTTLPPMETNCFRTHSDEKMHHFEIFLTSYFTLLETVILSRLIIKAFPADEVSDSPLKNLDLVELELRQIHEKQSRDDLQRRESIQRDPEV